MESVEEVKLCKATTKFKGTKNFNKTKDEKIQMQFTWNY